MRIRQLGRKACPILVGAMATVGAMISGSTLGLQSLAADVPAPAATPVVVPAPSVEPVKVQVSKSMTYDGSAKAWVFEGDVVVTYKGDVITADRISLPDEGGLIVADGNVVLKRDKQELKGRSITYDLGTRDGKIVEASARVAGEGTKGYVFVGGTEASGNAEHYALIGGHATTCDLEHPHYHLEAKSIEVWVDDRIVVKGLSYYEGKVRLLYWPYFVFPLKKQNALALPQIGYSSYEGLYVKTTYNYYLSPRMDGALRLDWFQNLGFGLGADSSFKLPSLKSDGTAKVYLLGNRKTDHADLSAEVRYNQPLFGGWNASLGLSQIGLSYKDETIGLLSLKKKSDNYTGELSGNLRNTVTGSDTVEEIRALMSHSYALSQTTTASLNASYVSRRPPTLGSSLARSEVLTYKAELKDVKPGRTLSLLVDDSVNPDRLQEGALGTWSYLSRLPEATAQFADIGLPNKLGKLTLPKVGATLSAGDYRETSWSAASEVRAARADLQLGFRDYAVTLGKTSKLELTGMGRVSVYEGGSERASISSGARLVQQIGSKSAARLGYSYDDYVGNTPFAFDSSPRAETISGSLDAKLGLASVSLGSSYNLRAASLGTPWGDLSATVSAAPSEKVTLSANASYNLNTDAWKQASATIKLKPSDALNVDGTMRYNFSLNRFEAFDTRAELRLGELRLGYSGQWDNTLQSFVKNDVSVGYHQHCREFRLTYRQSTKAVWLEYRLDAFPGTDVTVGGSQSSGLILDVNGLDNLVK